MCQELDLINNNEHRRLAEKILSGEMILFTGAGFSFGAKRKDTGELIPSVDELKRTISASWQKDYWRWSLQGTNKSSLLLLKNDDKPNELMNICFILIHVTFWIDFLEAYLV